MGKNKTYIKSLKMSCSDGIERVITVVGVYKQGREKMQVVENVQVEKREGCFVDGQITYPKTITTRKFTLGYAICNATDEFDEEEGKRIALRRIKTNPIGSLNSLNFSMLNSEMCWLLVLNEIKHIADHIEKYLKVNH